MNVTSAKQILHRFCSFPVSSTEDILQEFANVPGAIVHFDGQKKNFVYIPGTRRDRVLLVAHVDTVWDAFYGKGTFEQTLAEQDGMYSGVNPDCGIGADDRAGCAILYCLKESGHSLLIVDGEEHGQIGSNHIKNAYPEIFNELNRHSYVIQFDRRGSDNYKVYNLPVSKKFIRFIEKSTGFKDAGKNARTDIVVLCRDICGVNLSIGYYDEHSSDEKLVFSEWFKTLELSERMLRKEQTGYPLKPKSGLFWRIFH